MDNNKLQPARGVKDLIGDEFLQFQKIIDIARQTSSNFGFMEIATPIFEFTEIFKRTLGADSDVVGKEMYSFIDKGEHNITLRPEFTAGIARAFISNGLSQHVPLRLFTTGALFRYERPQKGRMRQFHQINFEIIGAKEAKADVEAISLAVLLANNLGLKDKLRLEINSLGDNESRAKYKSELVQYFNDYKNSLSEDSLRRLQINPMRILDSKDENDKKLLKDAPKMAEFLSSYAADFFEQVKAGLTNLSIDFIHNPLLVRGLDYYTHTAFELTTTELGAQNAVFAGGRYDNLIKIMGGQDTPAIGFAGGIERLILLSNLVIEKKQPISIVPIGEKAEFMADKLSFILRSSGFYIDLALNGNVGKRLKRADKLNAQAAIIFGDDELANNIVKIKDFATGEEQITNTSQLIDKLAIYS